MRKLLNLLRRQDGIAMPTVMGSMALTTVLATTTLAVSLDGNQTTSADRDGKRAAAAAQAGLDLALLHLQQAGPDQNLPCVQGPSPVAAGPNGQCVEYEVPAGNALSLGNGASVRYLVGREGAPGCRRLPGDDPQRDVSLDRCITATGVVNGVWRRAQSRVTFQPPVLGFGQAGLVGEKLVDIGNNSTINSPIGSNVRVNAGANTEITNPLHLKPGATTGFHGSVQHGGIQAKNPPWALQELDWRPARSKKAWTDTALSGIPGWDRLTRTLTLSNRQTINLSAGDYHVCNVIAPNNNAITVTNGQIVRLWVDSDRGNTPGPDGVLHTADDGGAGCPADSGRFVMGNNGTVNASDDRNPAEFELYMYGSRDNFADTGEPDVDIKNGGSFYWTIWAPKSAVAIKNDNNGNGAPQGEIVGAISAKSITLGNNGAFRHDNRVYDKDLPTTAASERRGWSECSSRPTVQGDPQSGCS